jgi:two-component system, LytTR family, sensor kinase
MASSESSTHLYQAAPGLFARKPWLIWLAVIGVWVLLGVIYAGPIYLEVRSEGIDHSAWRIFSWGILTWLVWAALTPFIVWLARRFPLDFTSWKRALLVHIPAFLATSVVHSAAATLITLATRPFKGMDEGEMAFWPRFVGRTKGSFGSNLLVYCLVLGVCYAIDYYRKYREREFLATQLESQLAQAQLDSLRMQLHPHFLFNTLNGIVGLVRDNKNEAAVSMLVGLSDLLRHALEHSSKQEVELREELNFIQLYLNLQQMRFSDRLKVEFDVEPATSRALVPNLILQPLAENALRHGFGRSVASGVIGIRSNVENGFLRLTVYDNGAGLPRNWQLQRNAGIGLTNTTARLEQLYEDEYEFAVRNREHGGVEVVLRIPFRAGMDSGGQWLKRLKP